MALILRILGGLVRIAALLLALASAAGALGGQAGRWKPALDVLNHFEPAWLLGAMAAGLVGWRDRFTVALAALALIACGAQMAPELLPHGYGATAQPGAERLKVVQLNAWVRNTSAERSARWILAEAPDVVVLEEATGDAAPILHALQTRYPYISRSCPTCAVAILSQRRPVASGPMWDPGFSAWASFEGPGGPYTVVVEHAAHPWPPRQQALEYEMLAQGIGRFAPGRLILAGDFNSTPWSFGLRRLDRMLPLIRRDRALATWPSAPTEAHGRKVPLSIPVLPIDHLYAGAGWRTLAVRRGPSIGSDHRPVVVTLQAAG